MQLTLNVATIKTLFVPKKEMGSRRKRRTRSPVQKLKTLQIPLYNLNRIISSSQQHCRRMHSDVFNLNDPASLKLLVSFAVSEGNHNKPHDFPFARQSSPIEVSLHYLLGARTLSYQKVERQCRNYQTQPPLQLNTSHMLHCHPPLQKSWTEFLLSPALDISQFRLP